MKKHITLSLLGLISIISLKTKAQTTINLADQCNCEVVKSSTEITAGATAPVSAATGSLLVDPSGDIFYWDGDSWEESNAGASEGSVWDNPDGTTANESSTDVSYTNGNVGIGTAAPGNSSLLELNATDKALVLTRVSDVNLITTPVNGMFVYDTTENCFKGYANGTWTGCLDGAGSSTGSTCNDFPIPTIQNVTSGGTYTLPESDRGFVLYITSLDNSFNLEINGELLVPQELQFANAAFSSGETRLQFNDGYVDGAGRSDSKLYIDESGNMTFLVDRGSGYEELTVVPGDPGINPNITWNTNANNTIIVTQRVFGPTNINAKLITRHYCF